jgi:MIP family channel proteins
MNTLLRDSLAELVGTFILVFIGAFAVTVAGDFGLVVPALAHGLALICIIYTYGHISGAHVNPAVTVGLLVGGKIDPVKAVAYIVAQIVGAILAALLVRVILEGNANMGETTGILSTTGYWRAALFEAILTFLLVSTVYQAAVYGKAGNLAGVAIGFTLAACIFAGGYYTGASLNPARTLGPALLSEGGLGQSYIIPYMLGIFGGGILAGLVQRFVFPPTVTADASPDYPLTEADQKRGTRR